MLLENMLTLGPVIKFCVIYVNLKLWVAFM